MAKNKKIKKYTEKGKTKQSVSLIVLLGVLLAFLYIILGNSELTFSKIKIMEFLNKDKSIQAKGSISKLNQKDVDEIKRSENKTSDINKKKELQIIRGEVQQSKNVTQKKEKNTNDVQVQAANKRLALIKVNDELNNAYTQVDSPKEKQVLSIIISTVGKLVDNPSYNFKSNKA